MMWLICRPLTGIVSGQWEIVRAFGVSFRFQDCILSVVVKTTWVKKGKYVSKLFQYYFLKACS